MALLFVFVDGIGLGDPAAYNPLYRNNYRSLERITNGQDFTRNAESLKTDDHVFTAVDACLEVEGLPQSGTGQASLFSGENASAIAGRHFGPYPYSKTRYLLEEQSMFHRAQDKGASCHFLNAYPGIFFKKAAERSRWTCTTLMTKSAGIALNSTADIKKKSALTADITQELWQKNLDLNVCTISPNEAAARALNAMQKHDFLLYEYFLTDKAGHKQDAPFTKNIMQRLDLFLNGLITGLADGNSLLLCSDHGNLENLDQKTHTRNNVPLYVKGPAAPFFHNTRSITDVTPAIIRYFESELK